MFELSQNLFCTISSHQAWLDASECIKGPTVIAFWQKDARYPEFQLDIGEAEWHCHARGQLLCIENGLIHLHTQHGGWLQLPCQVAWIPPGVLHQAHIIGVANAWSLSMVPAVCPRLPERPCVITATALMKALIQRVVAWTGQQRMPPEQRRISGVLWDELIRAPRETGLLPMPTDRRLRRIALAIIKQPADLRTLQEWAVWGGLSPRSLARLFRSEVQLSFAQWRRQVRLSHALQRLSQGETVATVAEALNYASPSNFIAMFRRSMGDSPAHYIVQTRRKVS